MRLFDAINSMGAALDFHRERHSVLSGNVANVDTPGYKPLDLARPEGAGAGTVAVAQTASGHMSPNPSGAGMLVESFEDTGQMVGADGNAVSLERELAKIDANRVRYAATAELVTRRMALLKYAAGGGV